jgi:hypothetical protein
LIAVEHDTIEPPLSGRLFMHPRIAVALLVAGVTIPLDAATPMSLPCADPEPSELALEQEVVTVTARGELMIRLSPADTTRALLAVPAGTSMLLGACTSGWCRVTRDTIAGYAPDSLLVRPAPKPPTPPRTCCRICTTGKACGNSCIARNRTCRVGVGCACDGGD